MNQTLAPESFLAVQIPESSHVIQQSHIKISEDAIRVYLPIGGIAELVRLNLLTEIARQMDFYQVIATAIEFHESGRGIIGFYFGAIP